MTFKEQFKRLTTDPAIHAEIDRFCSLVEAVEIPLSEKRKAAHEIWKAILPETAPGFIHARFSFWGQCIERCVWKGLYGYRVESHTDFLRREISPQSLKPTLVAHRPAPQVWTGHDEKYRLYQPSPRKY